MKTVRGMAIAALSLTVAGCANESGASVGLFSATAPVIAMLHHDLFSGTATGYMNGTGTIKVVSNVNEFLRCTGSFRYTGVKVGTGHVTCNDGTAADLQFNSLSSLSGYGIGISSRGPLSFTFGLTPEDATKYLGLPNGKTIQKKDRHLKLTSDHSRA